jgi:hypothetical protein
MSYSNNRDAADYEKWAGLDHMSKAREAAAEQEEAALKSWTGHTPGPWKVDHASRDIVHIEEDGSKRIIAYDMAGDYEDEANAKLMASAPELLEACKEVLKAFTAYNFVNWDALQRAIKKAEGE